MTHKHRCFTCNKIYDCNEDQMFIFDDGEGNEEWIDCDHPDNYELQCLDCVENGVPNPAFAAVEQQLLELGATITDCDTGEVKKLTKH